MFHPLAPRAGGQHVLPFESFDKFDKLTAGKFDKLTAGKFDKLTASKTRFNFTQRKQGRRKFNPDRTT